MSPVRSLFTAALLIAALVLCAGCTQSAPSANTETATGISTPAPATTTAVIPSPAATASPTVAALSGKKVRLETTMGNITIALDPVMPITAGNFETLVHKGFYDGIIFHRVIDGFMIQGGDPTGTGMGGPGYTIRDEPTHEINSRGAVAMANTGQPGSGGSQFFINLVNNSALQPGFDSHYPVFGNVVEGMDVVDAIGKEQTDANDRPLRNVTIVRAEMV
jgi:peptidylprolyl isomerase